MFSLWWFNKYSTKLTIERQPLETFKIIILILRVMGVATYMSKYVTPFIIIFHSKTFNSINIHPFMMLKVQKS